LGSVLVKRNLDPRKVVAYIWRPLLYATAVAVLALVSRLAAPDATWLALPFAPVGALASSMAIVVAFRANSAYQRWWEARTLWQNIANNSRILGRQVIASAADAISCGKGGPAEDVLAFRDDLVLRIIAFSQALRGELCGADTGQELRRLLSEETYAGAAGAHRTSNVLLTGIAVQLKEGVRSERVGTFDPITLEPNLAALHNWAGGAERIKETPIPRQYSFFSRMFIAVLVTLLPFGLLSLLPGASVWWLVPLSVLIGGLFVILERSSQVIDAPFVGATTDVPMLAICTTIERDLREQLGHTDLPAPPQPVDGYLW
jgi:ion channel-forming bestrophin family protein